MWHPRSTLWVEGKNIGNPLQLETFHYKGDIRISSRNLKLVKRISLDRYETTTHL